MMSYLFFLLLLKTMTSALDPTVTIDQGTLKGKILKSRSGRIIQTFQGIPFAAPPVGELRFKSPEKAPSWPGVRLAQREGSDCPQNHFILNNFVGNEDCLYLNVYTPQVSSPEKLSVMVWVHGGGYLAGSGSTEAFGPELLLDHDIVLVTFNYRLGPLGFLSLGTSSAPGNYGLKDQVAALRWVQKNIAKFGGNPDSVTIFGESAGGASVHYLMLSPLARGLFQRAIAQSGSAYNGWANNDRAAKEGRETATELGCNQQNLDDVLACLRQISPSQFVQVATTKLEKSKHITMFTPNIEPCCHEGAFLDEDPRAVLARGDISDVPLMAGLTTHEGMLKLFLLKKKPIEKDYQENIMNYVPSSELGIQPNTPAWAEAWQKIENFYRSISKDDFAEQYLLLNSDLHFVRGVDELVRSMAALGRKPVFYYQFSYDGNLGLLKQLAGISRPGTCHADELSYLFTQGMMPMWKKAPHADQLTITRLTKLWTNFARTGNPTPDESLGVIWNPVTSEAGEISTQFLDIGSQLEMHSENLNGNRIDFWTSLHKSFLKTKSRNVEL